MTHDWLSLAEQLLRIPSISSNTIECTNVLELVRSYLHPISSIAERPFVHNGVHSSLWHHENVTQPDVLLFAHLDVVDGSAEMFQPRIEGNRLFGRGVYDMKGPAAVLITLFTQLVSKHTNIGLLLTTDEELGGHNGAKYVLTQLGYAPKIVLLPDGGPNFDIVRTQKGIIWAKVSTTGLSAHASRPHKGKNAIRLLMQRIERLEHALKEVPNTTVCIANIEGSGPAFNAVADHCSAQLDIRTPDSTKAERIITQCFADASLHITQSEPSFAVNTTNETFSLYRKCVQKQLQYIPKDVHEAGGSDARFFPKYNIPVLLSTVVGGDHHTQNEWVDIQSLSNYQAIVHSFITQYYS